MKNGAIGVDEWVSLDGGNAFSLEAYRWVPAGVSVYDGTGGTSTELKIEFLKNGVLVKMRVMFLMLYSKD